MSRNIPSIKTILAFDAAARHENFSIAAQELHLTPGAVSKQIIKLEEDLSVMLFERHPKGVVLTTIGRNYHQSLNKALNHIENETNKIRDLDGNDNEIIINIAPSFSNWLIDKLVGFQKQYPELEISIINKGCGNLKSANADISIYASKSTPKNVCSHFLYEENLRLIGHPSLNIKDIADLTDYEFLEHQSRHGTLNGFTKKFGLKKKDLNINSKIEHFSNIVNMAKKNIGIGLVPDIMITDDLKDGTLSNPLDISYTSKYSYYLVYEKHKYYSRKIKKFRHYFF